jgi:hypothetical protein
MFCCIHDPTLASLLAGNEKDMPNAREPLLVAGFLGLHVLCLLSLGAWVW